MALGLVVLITGCGAPAGLGEGEPAPPASAQPLPRTLWPAWSPESSSPSDAVTDPALLPTPEPLADGPVVPADGFASLDQLEVLRADPRMRRLTRRGVVDGPGKPGIRPAVLHDLTGDKRPELISAVDLESGHVRLAVYTVREGRIVPILYTSGVRPVVEAVGVDLVVRSSVADGGEQSIRYRWDGQRMITVSEVRSYGVAGAGGGAGGGTDEGEAEGAGDSGSGTGPDAPAPGRGSGAPRSGLPKSVAPQAPRVPPSAPVSSAPSPGRTP
jgi:hypothetical protein